MSSALDGHAGVASVRLPGTVKDVPEPALLAWAVAPIRTRLHVLRDARTRMAARAEEFGDAISPMLTRSRADTLVTELLPLLDACRFLERNAERLLRPRKLGRGGRPFWLSGVAAEVHREPLGHVLVIGPANFPLFLPGTQALQALVAGNTVTWKPGAGGRRVAELVAECLAAAGLPAGTLHVTDDTIEAAQDALGGVSMPAPDKVVFTGSSSAGRSVLRQLAETATPAVLELSGVDAVIVLPSADFHLAAKAIAFGMRLNGGAVCMSPRRLFATSETMRSLRPHLQRELSRVPPVRLPSPTTERLQALLDAATGAGASVERMNGGSSAGDASHEDLVSTPVTLVADATPDMEIARADIFAPVLSLIEVSSTEDIGEAHARCAYGLTAAIFGAEREALSVGRSLRVGTVLINDLIAPTADPRVPFGGRGASGYGVTRGAEGLLEMTAAKTLLVRRSGRMRHLEPTRDEDAPLMSGLVRASHAGAWRERWAGVRAVIAASRKRSTRPHNIQE